MRRVVRGEQRVKRIVFGGLAGVLGSQSALSPVALWPGKYAIARRQPYATSPFRTATPRQSLLPVPNATQPAAVSVFGRAGASWQMYYGVFVVAVFCAPAPFGGVILDIRSPAGMHTRASDVPSMSGRTRRYRGKRIPTGDHGIPSME